MASNTNNIVYSFEPNNHAIEILKKLNMIYKNIFIQTYAVSNETGILKMTDSEYLDLNKLVELSKDGVDVSVITIDEFVEKEKLTHVDLSNAI